MSAQNSIIGSGFYPERSEPRETWLDRTVRQPALWIEQGLALRGARRFAGFVAAVNALGPEAESLNEAALLAEATLLRQRLRREGLTRPLVARSFALVRAAAARTVGMRHYDVQVVGGWILLRGRVAEMETGEGKTLTATLAAATAALAGIPTHVVTVNDYLAARDTQEMGPIYAALGLTVGCVTQHTPPPARAAAYRCDITYCTNKDLAFDYLRDRLALKGPPRDLKRAVDQLAGAQPGNLTLRGLHYAIVDEVDSVLVDEARTPLILSSERADGQLQHIFGEALEFARQLEMQRDFRFEHHETLVRITEAGKLRLAQLAGNRHGLWSGPNRREELVRQALTALHQYHRDRHYLVADGKIVIVDEFTGRTMPDRTWERGLHQMIETKENCPLTGQRETIARISYQRFFRRYLRLAGMTGTAKEVGAELWSVYRLRVTKVPTRKPVIRRILPMRLHQTGESKLATVVEAIRRERDRGRAILVGTRSVEVSERLATLLEAQGIPFRLLNARQDKEEAQTVAEAGLPGRVTVATNMAGRGTDIKLATATRAAGGLHVIATEMHEAQRIDRQLYGRCGRQGDPGSAEVHVSLDDELVRRYAAPLKDLGQPLAGGEIASQLMLRLAQRRAERAHALMRREVLEMDDYMGDVLAFAGKSE